MSQKEDDGGKKGFTVHDRRWWLDEDRAPKEFEEEPDQKLPSYVQQLQEQLEEKNRTLQEYINAHKASVADMDEVRQRLEKDMERRLEVEKARLAMPFIEVLDNLTRLHGASESGSGGRELAEGMGLIIKQLEDQLRKQGIEPISTQGLKFDPNTMEALMTSEVGPDQDGLVLDEIRPGFILGERVVRPAGVRVGISK
jgi:molecular chaperone GrpE